ncbi:MAG: ClbS/DfsB family four-helix bundle protein [Anaerolineae bacterium]|nr:ClbS/DfsB family four-helix bundle protein [Anaerolineae bacterium]
MTGQLNKAVILARMADERAAFEQAIAGLNAEQMTVPQVMDTWTIKDILAHITAWERDLLNWLDMAQRGMTLPIPPGNGWDAYIEEFNACTYAANRDRPLEDVLAEFDAIYTRLMDELRALPEDPADPLWAVWEGGQPPWRLLATFYGHYREHRLPIEAWRRGSMQA